MSTEQELIEAIKSNDIPFIVNRISNDYKNDKLPSDEIIHTIFEHGSKEILDYISGFQEDDNLLLIAIQKGNLNIFNYLYSEMQKKDSSLDISIYFSKACGAGQLNIAQHLLNNGANIENNNNWALRSAVTGNHIHIVQFLIDNNIDIHVNGEEALSYSINRNHNKIALLLIENGANLQKSTKIKDQKGRDIKINSFLHEVFHCGNIEILPILAKHGINIQDHKDNIYNLISYSLVSPYEEQSFSEPSAIEDTKTKLKTIDYLIQSGFNIHYEKEILFRKACEHNNITLIQYLLTKNTNIHAKNDDGFLRACINNHIDVVKLLIEHKVNPQTNNNFGLRLAAKEGNLDIVQYLISHGADINDNKEVDNYNAFKKIVHLFQPKFKRHYLNGQNALEGCANNFGKTYRLEQKRETIKYLYELYTNKESIEKTILNINDDELSSWLHHTKLSKSLPNKTITTSKKAKI